MMFLTSVVVVYRRLPRRHICNVTHQGAARDGESVVLCPVGATPCCYIIATISMPLRPISVGRGIMYLVCPSAAFVRLFVCLSGQILLAQYLMNGLSSLNETFSEEHPST